MFFLFLQENEFNYDGQNRVKENIIQRLDEEGKRNSIAGGYAERVRSCSSCASSYYPGLGSSHETDL